MFYHLFMQACIVIIGFLSIKHQYNIKSQVYMSRFIDFPRQDRLTGATLITVHVEAFD